MPYEKPMTEQEILNQEMNKKAEEFLYADIELFKLSNLHEVDFLERQKKMVIENPPNKEEINEQGVTDEYREKLKKLTIQSFIDEEQNKLKTKKRKEDIENIKNKIRELTKLFKNLFKKPLQ